MNVYTVVKKQVAVIFWRMALSLQVSLQETHVKPLFKEFIHSLGHSLKHEKTNKQKTYRKPLSIIA